MAQAQYNLGICYAAGQGVRQDDKEAAKWWRKAAEQGHTEAQHNIGSCYVNGQGVEQDYEEAVKWLRLSLAKGDTESLNVLKMLKKMGVIKNLF